jgi:hypothetical protein
VQAVQSHNTSSLACTCQRGFASWIQPSKHHNALLYRESDMITFTLDDMPTTRERHVTVVNVEDQRLMTEPSRDLAASGPRSSVCRASVDEEDDLLFDNVPV